MAQFEYTKEMIYAEFKEATAKDEKSKKPSYKHRVAMLKDMIALKRSNPQSLDNVDINFDNLLTAWSQPNPKDYFYMKVFGKTFAQKQADDDFGVEGFSDEDKNAKTLEERVEAMV
tara:strand:+ start:229 stop:576 length:348 start_codon:yes stop_codon:yes gene_type:complete